MSLHLGLLALCVGCLACHGPVRGNDSPDALFLSAPPPPNCANTGSWPDNDPQSVCAVRCAGGDSLSEVSATVDQVTTPPTSSPWFTAHVAQTAPQPCDQDFSSVVASWSGHFFNFDGRNPAYAFHLLTRGWGVYTDLDNLEVYIDDLNGGPVTIGNDNGKQGRLACLIFRN